MDYHIESHKLGLNSLVALISSSKEGVAVISTIRNPPQHHLHDHMFMSYVVTRKAVNMILGLSVQTLNYVESSLLYICIPL